MEDIGDRYFNILLSRSLFQDVVKEEGFTKFKMHDLLHEIACDVSNDRKLQLNYSSNSLDGKLWIEENQKIASKLRTITYYKDQMISQEIEKMIHDKMMNFVCLRVLIMNSESIHELPDSIGKLKHLRYLDISKCSIEKLPKSIVLLYSLQTLRMSWMVPDFPENFRKLVSLRHLEWSCEYYFFFQPGPQYLSHLTQLQTLSYFIVGFEKGHKITELGPLKNLRGSLSIYFLDQVESKEEAKTAKLVEKKNLHGLTFFWSSIGREAQTNPHRDFEVLEGLQPPKNLQTLAIESFLGECFPNNTFVENLVKIHLSSCSNCERLPMLGQLAELEDLRISWLCKIRSIGNEFYGIYDSNKKTILFPRLKRFELSDMRSLVQWEEVTVASNVSTFPQLEDLNVLSCNKLLNIPNVFGSCDDNGDMHLKTVNISDCRQLGELPDGLKYCHSIRALSICCSSCLALNLENKDMISSLRIMLPHKLAHLKIEIIGYHRELIELKLVDELESTSEDPWTEESGGIQTLPEWLENLTSLQTLRLSISEIESFACGEI